MKYCPECEGFGFILVDEPVEDIDYNFNGETGELELIHTGHIGKIKVRCSMCAGTGVINDGNVY